MLLGLFLFLPAMFLYAENCPTTNPPATPGTAVCNPASNFFVDLTGRGFPNTFLGIITFAVTIALGIVGALSMLFIIVGGFQYVTSRGNEEQAETGRKTLTNAIIGLVIVILSYVTVVVIINTLFKIK